VNPWLLTAADWWGKALVYSGPVFIGMEGMSSLLVAQKLGQEGKKVFERGESYQFGMLIVAAVAYVFSAWWIVDVREACYSSYAWVILIRSLSRTLRQRHHLYHPHYSV
jgi:hypothetical protein